MKRQKDAGKIKQAVSLLLEGLGEDVKREGLLETPDRVSRMWMGFAEAQKFTAKTFTCGKYDEMVVIKEIPFYSWCEHHLVPFFGTAKIGYLPKNKVVGLSKVARILDAHALRPQIQEKLTVDIARDLMRLLKPRGVGVIIEAEHLCMSMRGVKKPGSKTVTSCLLGVFRNGKTREEFLKL